MSFDDIFGGGGLPGDVFGAPAAASHIVSSNAGDAFGGGGGGGGGDDIFSTGPAEPSTTGKLWGAAAGDAGDSDADPAPPPFTLNPARVPPAALGRVRQMQVCPDPQNERIAVCSGGRAVHIYHRRRGNLYLDATLTGFTGVVLRCAWHFHRDAATGAKTYLLASSCDDGQVLVHQQNVECDRDDAGGVPRHASQWVVSFGGRREDARHFAGVPVTTLAWMPAGTLDDPMATCGRTELPFVLAAGSDRLALLSGWASAAGCGDGGGGIAWTVQLLDTDEAALVTALAWAPLQRVGGTRSLLAAMGTYDDDFRPAESHLLVFDFVREPQPPHAYVRERQTCITSNERAWTGWVRDAAWTALPHAPSSQVALAFARHLFLLHRADDNTDNGSTGGGGGGGGGDRRGGAGRWHLRRVQVVQTADAPAANGGSAGPPREFDVARHLHDIWQVAWSRHGTLLAVTAVVNTTMVVRKVVSGTALPPARRDLPAGARVHVVMPGRAGAVVKRGTVAAAAASGSGDPQQQQQVSVELDGSRRTAAQVAVDRVHHVELVNIYDTLVGGGVAEAAPTRGGRRARGAGPGAPGPAPVELVVESADRAGAKAMHTYETEGDVEMWEVVNDAQLARGLAAKSAAGAGF